MCKILTNNCYLIKIFALKKYFKKVVENKNAFCLNQLFEKANFK